jgi:hypothetical protein
MRPKHVFPASRRIHGGGRSTTDRAAALPHVAVGWVLWPPSAVRTTKRPAARLCLNRGSTDGYEAGSTVLAVGGSPGRGPARSSRYLGPSCPPARLLQGGAQDGDARRGELQRRDRASGDRSGHREAAKAGPPQPASAWSVFDHVGTTLGQGVGHESIPSPSMTGDPHAPDRESPRCELHEGAEGSMTFTRITARADVYTGPALPRLTAARVAGQRPEPRGDPSRLSVSRNSRHRRSYAIRHEPGGRRNHRVFVTADHDSPRRLVLHQASRPGIVRFRGGATPFAAQIAVVRSISQPGMCSTIQASMRLSTPVVVSTPTSTSRAPRIVRPVEAMRASPGRRPDRARRDP